MQRHTPSTYANPLGPSPAYDTQFYEAYGALRQDYGILTSGHSTPSHKDPVGFGGQWGNYTDTETNLLCLTHRYYDTGTGRFINRDPIDYAGGVNLYGYAGNNPINEMDPSGLDPAGQFTSFGGYLGEVGDVFRGYGDTLNPVNAARSLAQIYQIGRGHGARAAGTAVGQGVYHGLIDWTSTNDARRFGQSFSTVLLTAAPGVKKIPLSLRAATRVGIATSVAERTVSFFHKGYLDNPSRSLSTGVAAEDVSAVIEGDAPVHEFQVPESVMLEWERSGLVTKATTLMRGRTITEWVFKGAAKREMMTRYRVNR